MSKKDTRARIREDILTLLKRDGEKRYRPKEIARRLDYRNDRLYGLFRDVLDDMDEKQLVQRVKGNKYTFQPPSKRGERTSHPNQVEGTIHVNEKGFAFVEIPEREDDVYVNARNLGTALDGDLVRLELFAAPAHKKRNQEGKVLDVVERRRTQTVGTFQKKGHFAFVEPDDQRLLKDIYVPSEAFSGARDGQKVLVSIDRYEAAKANPEGRVLRIIGDSEEPGVRVLSLAMSLDVKAEFPEAVEAEAEEIPDHIPQEEIDHRLDLREEAIFTIDPEDAKDFDDAIHIKELSNGNLEVGVHIADVSHYVKPDTKLDDEAYQRGTSVYLVDRVIPMLPEKLSNRVCSLRPEEDKLAYSCIMEVTPQGDVVEADFKESVIRSQQRFTYEEAQNFIDGGYPDHPLASDIVQAARLARTLTRRRMREGSVDFDLPEVKVILGDDGRPVEIRHKKRLQAHRLVEEMMLMANRTVASAIGDQDNPLPFVYRIHDVPDSERIQKLAQYIRAFGYDLPMTNGNVGSRQLNDLLDQVKGSPEEHVIEDAALRAMSKAEYGVENIGHYGLGFDFYTHFTSPIRRYPDLMVHRLLKRYTAGKGAAKDTALSAQCEHCSERERNAVEAERESVKLKQVEYARQHLGEEFDGVVRGVTKFGVFVEINDLLVEGLVHVRDMNDYFEYDEERFTLVGQDSGRTYRPGDTVRVQLVSADPETREIDLLFVDEA